MFDDVNTQGATNQESEPKLDDMFGDTDPLKQPESTGASGSPSTPMAQPNIPTPDMPVVQTASYGSSSSIGKKILIAFVLIVVVAGLGVLGWWYYSQVLKTRATDLKIQPAVTTPKVEDPAPLAVPKTPVVEEPAVVTPPPAVITPPEPVDRDGDGLTDAEEAEAGTNPLQSDTDNDGLFDREEIVVYGTNPLKEDTDGDTFLDGAEVQNGYNPNGPGLLDLSITPPTSVTPSLNN